MKTFPVQRCLMNSCLGYMAQGYASYRVNDMQVIVDTTLKMGLTPEDDFILRVVQLSELLAIRHCVFLMGPTGSGRSECYKVLAKAIQTGTDKPVNTYLEACNRKKVLSTTLCVTPVQTLCTNATPLPYCILQAFPTYSM